MNSTTTLCTTTANSTTTNSSNNSTTHGQYHPVLLAIYSVVLLIGTISLSLMMHIMKSSTTSFTSIAVLNLIFTHFIFLLTVPFRIYYYALNRWGLNPWFCKFISAMIHVHMYMSFIFYVIILITRLMTFYCKAEQVASMQKVHALLGSAVVWMVVLVTTPCVIEFYYGKDKEGDTHGEKCFHFGKNINDSVQVLNHIISTLIIVVAILLTALQANVLRVLYRKHRKGCTSQQDFGAQLKSLCFALIMVICFIPYHVFRIYYVAKISELQNLNEVFLSLTTFNCLDMLTFLGRRTCSRCFPGKIV
ncbi:probable G-protein coupled receptor 141 [Thunnus maccoyii]|uniref:probable G-protein coupled receptor 141 n=1 Tax=Thunnus maccoyii TaxID=8240 RepID=UPI001C4C2EB3|nr:probable G-protein coupled receptor 141 [Thunnus maccoyii]